MEMDLNADLGEGFGAWRMGDDDALLDVVTSANVACGFHAGDPPTMRRVTARAAALGVAVGAHVAYRDLVGFGRRELDVDADDLADDVTYQIGALDAFCRVAGDRVRYVKPHGALYNRCVRDDAQARAVVEGVRRYDPGLGVLALPGSRLLARAEEAGLSAIAEAFADRAYTRAGELVPRSRPGAVVRDRDTVVARSVRIATLHDVETEDGGVVAVPARSLCVHGDTPGAVELARAVRAALEREGVRPTPFASGKGR